VKDKTYNKIMIVGCAILGLALILIAIATNLVEKADKEIIYINHIVKQGENLTQIADRYSEEYLPKAICEIKKLNNMTESDLIVGQVLKVEVK